MARLDQRFALFDAVEARAKRAVAFLSGLAIMVYETVVDRSDRPWLYAAALGMMGMPIARVAESVLSRFGSSGPGTQQDPYEAGDASRLERERRALRDDERRTGGTLDQ